jgi:hypothetical protein
MKIFDSISFIQPTSQSGISHWGSFGKLVKGCPWYEYWIVVEYGN